MDIVLLYQDETRAVAPSVANELDQLVAGIRTHWLVEHNGDGTHANITATSIVVAGDGQVDGTLDVGENLMVTPTHNTYSATVVSGTPQASALTLGWWSKASNDYTGVRWPTGTTGGFTSFLAWGLGARSNGAGPTHPSVLAISHDSAFGYDVLLLRTGTLGVGNGWYLVPHDITSAADGGIFLGDNASGKRFTGVYCEKVYPNQGVYERGRTTAQGEWISVAYNAANFTSSAGTWTVDSGDQITYAYTLVGKTMTLSVWLQNTTLATASAAQLKIAIPGGFVAAKNMQDQGWCFDAGAWQSMFLFVQAAATVVTVSPGSLAGWSIETNAKQIRFTMAFEVQ